MKWKEEKLAENFSHLMMKYLALMVTIKMEAIDTHYRLHSKAPCDINSNMARSSKASFTNIFSRGVQYKY